MRGRHATAEEKDYPNPITVEQGLTRLPPRRKEIGRGFEHGTLQVKFLRRRAAAMLQTPHTRRRSSCRRPRQRWFVGGSNCSASGVHDAPSRKPAGASLEDFSDDFVIWVFFYGPEGGEKP
jgi:hypothetical protein